VQGKHSYFSPFDLEKTDQPTPKKYVVATLVDSCWTCLEAIRSIFTNAWKNKWHKVGHKQTVIQVFPSSIAAHPTWQLKVIPAALRSTCGERLETLELLFVYGQLYVIYFSKHLWRLIWSLQGKFNKSRQVSQRHIFWESADRSFQDRTGRSTNVCLAQSCTEVRRTFSEFKVDAQADFV
jgi:hypothetical protein